MRQSSGAFAFSHLLEKSFLKEVKGKALIVEQERKQFGERSVCIPGRSLGRNALDPGEGACGQAGDGRRRSECSWACRGVQKRHTLHLMWTFVSVNFSLG